MAFSAVRAALETAETLDATNVATIEKEHDRLKAVLDNLLPAERPAYREIEQRCRHLGWQREMLVVAESLGGLPRLSMSVLSWTKRQKMPYKVLGHRPTVMVPTFAYLPVMDGHVELSVNEWGVHATGGQNTPSSIRTQYQKALQPLVKHSDSFGTPDWITMKYEYSGAVPNEIKKIINNETRFPRQDMAFICEVDEWKVTARRRAPLRERVGDALLDPILVGHKHDALWVLGSFDPTPVEQYLLNEFTS